MLSRTSGLEHTLTCGGGGGGGEEGERGEREGERGARERRGRERRRGGREGRAGEEEGREGKGRERRERQRRRMYYTCIYMYIQVYNVLYVPCEYHAGTSVCAGVLAEYMLGAVYTCTCTCMNGNQSRWTLSIRCTYV